MSETILDLVAMVVNKNTINNKRLRFLRHMLSIRFVEDHQHLRHLNPKANDYYNNYLKRKFAKCLKVKPTFSLEEAEQGYNAARHEGKQLMIELKALRKKLGARLIWGAGGQVMAIRTPDTYIYANQFDEYVAKKALDDIINEEWLKSIIQT